MKQKMFTHNTSQIHTFVQHCCKNFSRQQKLFRSNCTECVKCIHNDTLQVLTIYIVCAQKPLMGSLFLDYLHLHLLFWPVLKDQLLMLLLKCTESSSCPQAMIHYCVGWCDVCFVTVQQKHSVQVNVFFLPFSSQTLITCRWTTSYYRTCVMRRQWLLWRTPLIWSIWRWPNQDQYISMTCTPLQTTPAVRIYLLVFGHSFIVVHEQLGSTFLLHECFTQGTVSFSL